MVTTENNKASITSRPVPTEDHEQLEGHTLLFGWTWS